MTGTDPGRRLSTPARSSARRGARDAGLSPDAIVDVALELIEREGTGALTVRRLGAELAVDPTAFYRHFRDKDDLVLACMDRAEQLAFDALRRRTDSLSWQDTLRAVADENWRMAETYPAIYASAFARITGGPGERAVVELVLSRIAELGLDRPTTVLFYRSFVDTVLSLAGGNAVVQHLGPDILAKDESTWGRVYAQLPPEKHPATHAHATELGAVSDRAIYAHVVETLIAAMETAAGRAQAR